MSKEMMLALPEVSYLVERIPVARLVLKPTAIHLRFCQHAKESGMPLKEQCRLMGIPWHARKISAGAVSKNALEASRVTEPTVFVATFPGTAAAATRWSHLIVDAKAAAYSQEARHWLAFNAVELADAWEECKAYLRTIQPAKGLAVKTFIKRAKEHNAEIARATAERMRQMNMVDWNGIRAADMQRYMNDVMNDRNNPYAQQIDYQQRMARLQIAQMEARQDAGMWHGALLGGLVPQFGPRDNSPIVYEARYKEPMESGDFVLTLLSTYEEFRDEGKNMHHCVEQYFPRAKAGACFIVAMKTRTRKVATAEFTPDWELIQAKGPANTNVADSPAIIDAFRAFGRRQKGDIVQLPAAAPRKVAGRPPEGQIERFLREIGLRP